MKNKKGKYAQSRLQKNILSLSAFLLVAVIAFVDRGCHQAYLSSQNAFKADANDWEKYHKKSFTVVKVIDGDTIDINIPDGNHSTTRIRLLGVDSPETEKSPRGEMFFGKEAREFTTRQVLGKNITVIMDKVSKPRDRYRRLLCYTKLPNEAIFNELLVSEGLAYADERFSHTFYEKYLQLEKMAQKQKKGLWKELQQKPAYLKKDNRKK